MRWSVCDAERNRTLKEWKQLALRIIIDSSFRETKTAYALMISNGQSMIDVSC